MTKQIIVFQKCCLLITSNTEKKYFQKGKTPLR